MSITRIKTNKRMSQAVVYQGLVTTAGQVAQDTAGGDIAAQTSEILGKIDLLLAQAGSDKSQLLTAQIWLSDMNDFTAMNEVWDEWIIAGSAPTRACVESRLALPALVGEIAVTAALVE